MSSDYKGKNIFGADVYQGQDGSIHHNKEDADRTYRTDYNQTNSSSYNSDSSYNNQSYDYNAQSSQRSYSGSTTPLISAKTMDKLLGLVFSFLGSWVITWLFITIQQNNRFPGVLFKFLSLVSWLFLWPAKVTFNLISNHTIPAFPLLYAAVPLLNFFWLCIVGLLFLKKSKMTRLFGKKSKKYKELSWFKVSLLLLSFQLLVTLTASI